MGKYTRHRGKSLAYWLGSAQTKKAERSDANVKTACEFVLCKLTDVLIQWGEARVKEFFLFLPDYLTLTFKYTSGQERLIMMLISPSPLPTCIRVPLMMEKVAREAIERGVCTNVVFQCHSTSEIRIFLIHPRNFAFFHFGLKISNYWVFAELTRQWMHVD